MTSWVTSAVRIFLSLLRRLNQSLFSSVVLTEIEPLSRPTITWQNSKSPNYTFNLHPRTSLSVSEIGLIYCFFESTLTFNGNTGVQRVARQTARALAESSLRVIASTWDAQTQTIEPLLPKEIHHLSKWSGPRPKQWHPWVPPTEAPKNSWLMSNEMPPKLGVGINSELLKFAELNKLRTSVTFFDAIPLILPDLYPAGTEALHYSYMEQLAEWDLICPISMQSAKDMLDLLSDSTITKHNLIQKLHPISLPHEFPVARSSQSSKVAINSRPFILVVSTFEQRKNHISLLKAAVIAQQSLPFGFDLILVGHPLESAVVKLVNSYKKMLPNINVVCDASDEQIQRFFELADFTIFPSIEEGFGLPIVESLWHGKPVICDNQRAINELAKEGGCLRIDVLNVEEFAEAIVTLATDLDVYNRKCKEIESRSFSTWNNYVSHLVSSMLKVASLS